MYHFQVAMASMYTADMAFFARVADPLVGGTYMTLMNISYIGGKLVKTFSMWLVDILTWKSCAYDEFFNFTVLPINNKCGDELAVSDCEKSGGHCQIDIDGYYIEVVSGVVFGIFWFQWAKKIINYLQTLPISDWHVLSNQTKHEIAEIELFQIIREVQP
jgi:MFS transporter, PAT family, solute carrier family 33 (acetyl-CoA transportor), member 1